MAKVLELLQDTANSSLLNEAIENILKKKGLATQQIKDFFDKACSGSYEPKLHSDFSGGILNTNATIYFLEREIKRQQRYDTPFSCLIITVSKLWTRRGIALNAGDNEVRYLLPQMIDYLKKMLRDLDLVGTLGLISRNMPFVILPMTDDAGSLSVINRLNKAFSELTFECNKEPVTADFTISSTSIGLPGITDCKSFLDQAITNHTKEEVEKNII